MAELTATFIHTLKKHIFLLILLLAMTCACSTKRNTTADHAAAGLTRAEQRDYDLLFLEATFARMKDTCDAEAFELYDVASRIDPAAAEPHYWKGLIKTRHKQPRDTAEQREIDELLEMAARCDSLNEEIIESRTVNFATTGRIKEAVATLEKLPSLNYDDDMLGMLMELHYKFQNYDAAIDCIDRIETLMGKNEHTSMLKFQILLQKGDIDNAYAAVKSLCADNPGELNYEVLLASLYAQHGRSDEAVDILKGVLSKDPENFLAQDAMAEICRKSGDETGHREWFSKLLLNPTTPNETIFEKLGVYVNSPSDKRADSAWIMPVLAHLIARDDAADQVVFAAASMSGFFNAPDSLVAKGYERTLALRPDHRVARLSLLEIKARSASTEEILKLCREGAEIFPSDAIFHYYAGLSLFMLKREAEALDVVCRGTQSLNKTSDIDHSFKLYQLKGDLLHEQGRNDEAYLAYDTALIYIPDDAMTLNNYAYFLSLDGKWLEKAEEMSRQAVEQDSTNSTFLDTYAWVLCRREKYDEALHWITLAETHFSKDNDEQGLLATVLEHKGDILAMMGRTQDAMKCWKAALPLADEDKQRTIIRKKIRLKKYVKE